MVVHLHARSSYSLLDSSLSVQRLVQKSKELGFSSVAITDKNVLMGAMEFTQLCKKMGIKPLYGMEIDCIMQEEVFSLLMIAKNNEGYENLIRCSSLVSSGKPLLFKDVSEYASGNFILFYGEGGLKESLLINEEYGAYRDLLAKIQQHLDITVVLSLNESSFWKIRNDKIREIAKDLGIKTIALNKIYYENEKDEGLYRIVQGIKTGKTIQSHSLSGQQGRFIRSIEEMEKLYHAEDLAETNWIADQCDVDITKFKTFLPKFATPENIQAGHYLTQLCLTGLKKRLGMEEVPGVYTKRLKYELDVIIQMNFEDYFLIVWDFIRFARKEGINVGPGRGSSAGSLVAYCLGITQVDPIEYGLLFERFLNPERISMPDIDIDFPDDRRDEVIQYVFQTYGQEHVAHIVTFGTLKAKQVLRDVGRVLEVPLHEINTITKAIPFSPKMTLRIALDTAPYFRQLIQKNKTNQHLFDVALKLEGLPRHVSTHAAGIVLSNKKLDEVVPTIQVEQELVSTQYTMDYLENIGLIKMDFLGLRNLTIIDQIVRAIQEDNENFNIQKISLADEKTFELLRKVDTVGVFQLESDGMKNLLKKMQATHFNDIVATIALFRPGPMENIPMYLSAREGKEKIKYPHPSLEPVLKETFGIMIYQEQIMQVAQIMAGFSLGKADILRKAMSKKKESDLIKLRADFIEGCRKNGHLEELSQNLFDLIIKFAGYGFNKAHSVSYGMVAYQLAYLKANYPYYFYCALLNSVIGADSKTAEYIDECRRKNIELLPPSVNESESFYILSENKIRVPLLVIKNIGQAAVEEIKKEREKGKFEGFHNFVARIMTRKVNKKMIESLIDAGALDEFKENRKTMRLSLDDAIRYADLVRIETADQARIDLGLVSKPVLIVAKEDKAEQNEREKEVMGFFLSEHPILEVKKKNDVMVDSLVVLQSKHGQVDGFCCIQKIKQHRTKKGDLMAFVVGQDETADMDLVFMPFIYQKVEKELNRGDYLFFSGKMDEKGSCLVNSIKRVSEAE